MYYYYARATIAQEKVHIAPIKKQLNVSQPVC